MTLMGFFKTMLELRSEDGVGGYLEKQNSQEGRPYAIGREAPRVWELFHNCICDDGSHLGHCFTYLEYLGT